MAQFPHEIENFPRQIDLPYICPKKSMVGLNVFGSGNALDQLDCILMLNGSKFLYFPRAIGVYEKKNPFWNGGFYTIG